jgi:hypothetical protein
MTVGIGVASSGTGLRAMRGDTLVTGVDPARDRGCLALGLATDIRPRVAAFGIGVVGSLAIVCRRMGALAIYVRCIARAAPGHRSVSLSSDAG